MPQSIWFKENVLKQATITQGVEELIDLSKSRDEPLQHGAFPNLLRSFLQALSDSFCTFNVCTSFFSLQSGWDPSVRCLCLVGIAGGPSQL